MQRNIVFVIGAGASKEANLPTGLELKDKISKLLDIRFEGYQKKSGDHVIYDALRLHVEKSNEAGGNIFSYLQEAEHISEALPLAISIDNFIDAHKDNEKIAFCGKLAIIRSILDAEKNSLLYFKRSQADSNINFSNLETTWYLPFFQILTENCGKNDLKDRFQSITLIIFNYDRCIEYFILNALQKYYRISKDEAADLVRCINVYHPYGSVGSLTQLESNSVTMDFGEDPRIEQLLPLSQKIKTFTEGTDPSSSEILAIQRHMSKASKLVFMGFAFHKLNMQLITPNKNEGVDYPELKNCYATTYGISESDKEVINRQINELYNREIDTKMVNLKCGNFFTEFWRSLAF